MTRDRRKEKYAFKIVADKLVSVSGEERLESRHAEDQRENISLTGLCTVYKRMHRQGMQSLTGCTMDSVTLTRKCTTTKRGTQISD